MKYLVFLPVVFFSLFVNAQNKEVTLEDIWKKGTFRSDYVRGFHSMQDGEHYTEIEKGTLLKKSFATGKKVSEFNFYKDLSYNNKKLNISSFKFNDAENKMLIFTESEKIYRHSSLYKVYVYDLNSKELSLVSDEKVLHATFSPDSEKVAFVKGNDLYYLNLKNNRTTRITSDGATNIINGNCDWVYEEEFGFTKAFQWSPDGKYLAFYRFDQSAVPEFTMMYFSHLNKKELYPNKYEFKYPKAGDPNSKIKIGLYDVKKDRTKFIANKDEYIPRIKWTNYDSRLVIYTLNRHQNHLRMHTINPSNLNERLIYEEKNKYYVDISDQITFLQDKNAFLFTSERSGYNHIYYQDIRKNRTKQITKGNWEVTSLHGIDEPSGTVYFSSAEKSPLDRNLYSIKINGRKKKLLTPEKGWHSISFSNKFKYFVDNYSNVNSPAVFSMKNNNGATMRILKDNASLKSKIKNYAISPQELIKVPVENGVVLNGWIIKPPKFNKRRKYPLIMFQYSGPGSQQVTNKYPGGNFWWYQMLAQKGYIIACVDGRGTGYRGEEFKKMTYQQLGKYETDDQIAAAKYFGSKRYIDKSRIGIWGWSYGGYMSSICIAKGADVFKSAIAVAPVTNWRYYDNIYTERYMRTPQENPNGYDDNSPINMVDKIKGNYLLIHGSGDDNVHYQNTMEMINAMIKADVEFDSEIYPNRNHGIYGGNTRFHLYKKMTKFWLEKL